MVMQEPYYTDSLAKLIFERHFWSCEGWKIPVVRSESWVLFFWRGACLWPGMDHSSLQLEKISCHFLKPGCSTLWPIGQICLQSLLSGLQGSPTPGNLVAGEQWELTLPHLPAAKFPSLMQLDWIPAGPALCTRLDLWTRSSLQTILALLFLSAWPQHWHGQRQSLLAQWTRTSGSVVWVHMLSTLSIGS